MSGRDTASSGEAFPIGGAGTGRTALALFLGAGGFLGTCSYLRLGLAPPKEAEEKIPEEVEGLGS